MLDLYPLLQVVQLRVPVESANMAQLLVTNVGRAMQLLVLLDR